MKVTLKPKSSLEPVSHEQAAMLHAQMVKMGYRNMLDFAIKAGLVVSHTEPGLMAYATIARAFRAGDRNVTDIHLAVIMLRLQFSLEEIDRILEERGDVFVRAILSSVKSSALEPWQMALVEAITRIVEVTPESLHMLVQHIQLMGAAAGVDVSQELGRISRKGARKVRA